MSTLPGTRYALAISTKRKIVHLSTDLFLSTPVYDFCLIVCFSENGVGICLPVFGLRRDGLGSCHWLNTCRCCLNACWLSTVA